MTAWKVSHCFFKEEEDQIHTLSYTKLWKVFWDTMVCIVVDFLPRKETVSAVHYIEPLHNFATNIQ
jgi:hypothetical protein